MNTIVLFGRIAYAAIFVIAAQGHFSQETIGYAAAQGVPMASIVVPFSGVISALGGLSVALGYRAKWGAWLLVLFLVPVTVMMHKFWAVSDPMMAQIHQVMFMKNLAILGGTLLI